MPIRIPAHKNTDNHPGQRTLGDYVTSIKAAEAKDNKKKLTFTEWWDNNYHLWTNVDWDGLPNKHSWCEQLALAAWKAAQENA